VKFFLRLGQCGICPICKKNSEEDFHFRECKEKEMAESDASDSTLGKIGGISDSTLGKIGGISKKSKIKLNNTKYSKNNSFRIALFAF
jgi:hypothetical protein